MQIQTLRGQERGVAHLGLAIVVIVVLAVIGFAGYTVMGSNKKASTKTTTATADSEKAAADSSCVETYEDENLCKFATRGGELEKLAFEATAAVTGGEDDGEFSMKNDGKGNSSMTLSGGGFDLSTVTYDGRYYMQNVDGSWTDYGTDSDDTDPTEDMNFVLGSGITYTPQGKEACGSLTCFKYALKDAESPESEQTVWFDTKDYLARKWVAVTTEDGVATTTVLTISYPGKVSIAKPSPVVPLQ